jgi:hypothetical protein
VTSASLELTGTYVPIQGRGRGPGGHPAAQLPGAAIAKSTDWPLTHQAVFSDGSGTQSEVKLCAVLVLSKASLSLAYRWLPPPLRPHMVALSMCLCPHFFLL